MALGHLLALILGIADFLTEEMFRVSNNKKMRFISFAAGISVAYVFLILLPEIYTTAKEYGHLLYFPVLAGFSLFHLTEKHIRQKHGTREYEGMHEVVHTVTSFIYFLVVGFVLVRLVETDSFNGMLFFIPMFLHVVIDSLPKKITKHYFYKAFFASSPFIGALIGGSVATSRVVDIVLLGLVGGALLYMIVRESLPREREGKPLYFLVGLLLFSVFILMLRNGFS